MLQFSSDVMHLRFFRILFCVLSNYLRKEVKASFVKVAHVHPDTKMKNVIRIFGQLCATRVICPCSFAACTFVLLSVAAAVCVSTAGVILLGSEAACSHCANLLNKITPSFLHTARFKYLS